MNIFTSRTKTETKVGIRLKDIYTLSEYITKCGSRREKKDKGKVN